MEVLAWYLMFSVRSSIYWISLIPEWTVDIWQNHVSHQPIHSGLLPPHLNSNTHGSCHGLTPGHSACNKTKTNTFPMHADCCHNLESSSVPHSSTHNLSKLFFLISTSPRCTKKCKCRRVMSSRNSRYLHSHEYLWQFQSPRYLRSPVSPHERDISRPLSRGTGMIQMSPWRKRRNLQPRTVISVSRCKPSISKEHLFLHCTRVQTCCSHVFAFCLNLTWSSQKAKGHLKEQDLLVNGFGLVLLHLLNCDSPNSEVFAVLLVADCLSRFQISHLIIQNHGLSHLDEHIGICILLVCILAYLVSGEL
ncbi:uncharacterized protein LOC131401076 isoform X2 [Diceros bicornis minor]|uniref:uncharacterized protein LOC131401076 isoform X2 n=1 Tax=Diceros bicornis minor TaxID=77932 RepID=UPI0026F2230C|nr:uncharacterized protein LOC131401076 isoform X2 [Diceros bicornis minor]